MRALILFSTVVALLTMPVPAVEYQWVPDIKGIKKIERKLRLPRGGYKLKHYVRYYWGTLEDGVPILNGEFYTPISDNEEANKIFINDSEGPPAILDGGCSVINLRWNMASGELIALWCNGVA